MIHKVIDQNGKSKSMRVFLINDKKMMFYRALQVFFHFFTILLCISGETLVKKNEKRTNFRNNYQMCLDSFKIHEDKIIRTQESRDMGAKFLKEYDVDSREDCLKFCCDTESCDVFIFEEKVYE